MVLLRSLARREGPVWTHIYIVSVRSNCLSHSNPPSQRTVTSWSSDIFPTSATTVEAAACRREEWKRALYPKATYPRGMSVQVVPLVMELLGQSGKYAKTYLDQLSKRSRDERGKLYMAKFIYSRDYRTKRIAIQLKKNNAKVFLRKTFSLLQAFPSNISDS